jgi:Domain of unknown function (DUF6457)
MSTLEEWAAAVVAELGLADAVTGGTRDMVLDLARDVAHGVARPAAPLTTYLVGLAAGRAADPATAAPELAATVTRLAQTWAARSPSTLDPANPATGAGPEPPGVSHGRTGESQGRGARAAAARPSASSGPAGASAERTGGEPDGARDGGGG